MHIDILPTDVLLAENMVLFFWKVYFWSLISKLQICSISFAFFIFSLFNVDALLFSS